MKISLKLVSSLIAIVLALASISLVSGCGPSTKATAASAKTSIEKSISKVSAKVSVHMAALEVNTAEAALEAVVPASPTKTIAAMPSGVRIDLARPFEYPSRYGFTNCSISTGKAKALGFKGIGHDHYARADV